MPAVIPEASKAFVLCVPDDAFFYGVVMGAIKTMTFRYYWQGTREQIDAVTERMLTMYYDYQEQTGCMICELVIDCLENDEATKAAIQNLVRGMTTNPATNPYGQNQPESELTRDVAAGTNPTCNLDVLWAQCLNVVKITNLAIVDVLQKFEVSTNIAELVNGLIDIVPILGSAKQIIGASGALDLMNYFQESFSEGYLAQYTETPGGVQDQIACDLFCACKIDCQITIERVEEVMRARLEEHITVVTVTDFVDLVETIAGIEPDTSYVVDLAFWFGWVAVRVGNFLFGQTFNGGLDLIVALAADEPNNDWELLCDDCAFTWQNVGIFSLCGEAVIDQGEFEDGVPFDVEAFEVVETGITSYQILLKLPSGNWNVQLNSITGTITPPADTSETAYAWHDTSGTFHNVLWNAPGSPDEFGDHDTTRAIFAPWCNIQAWNAALFNSAPFTANFTITAI